MRILVRLPNWLGDAVMATPALANLTRRLDDPQLVLVGAPGVAAMFRGDPTYLHVEPDTTKSHRLRPVALWRLARRLRRQYGPFDLAIALPNSLSSAFLLRAAGAERRVGSRRGWKNVLLTDPVTIADRSHQVRVYNQVINRATGHDDTPGPMTLHVPTRCTFDRATVGIAPGAAYGSAKRWKPKRFGAVAAQLAARYDIVIFGAPPETAMAAEIEDVLRRHGVTNYRNVAGKTTIAELLSMIAGLDLLIANDSGAMHIGAALGIPLVVVFGATDPGYSHPWHHDCYAVVHHPVPCAPCMRRTCPLDYHACMEEISPDEVLAAVDAVESKRAAA